MLHSKNIQTKKWVGTHPILLYSWMELTENSKMKRQFPFEGLLGEPFTSTWWWQHLESTKLMMATLLLCNMAIVIFSMSVQKSNKLIRGTLKRKVPTISVLWNEKKQNTTCRNTDCLINCTQENWIGLFKNKRNTLSEFLLT